MRKRWEVQAGMREDWVKTPAGSIVPYAPTQHASRWAARRQVRKLEDSFAPGMAWVRMRQIDGADDAQR
jgi:hypothetical protein